MVVVSLNPVHGEVYSIQHYVIKFVSNLQQVGDFLRVLRFPPPIKLTATIPLSGTLKIRRSEMQLIEKSREEIKTKCLNKVNKIGSDSLYLTERDETWF
jgi:hypothetical protein